MNTNFDHSPSNSKKEIVFAFLRIVLGAVILLKGFAFFKDSSQIQALIKNHGFEILDSNIAAIAFFITYFNLLGGTFIIAGFFTRWIALFQIPVIIGAIIFVNSEAGLSFNNMELALSVLILLLLFLFLIIGSGPYSADEFFRSYTHAGQKTGYTKKFFNQ